MKSSPVHVVLLVDDDPAMLEMLSDTFEDANFTVATASDGSIALDILKSLAFDIVISDIDMPNLDGVSLCRIIKKQFPSIPVILLTGIMREENIHDVSQLGVKVIQKPFCIKELVQSATDLISPKKK